MEKSNEQKELKGAELEVQNHKLKSNGRQKGASLVEYALLVGLITVIAIAGVRVLGERVSTQFSTVASQV